MARVVGSGATAALTSPAIYAKIGQINASGAKNDWYCPPSA